MIFFSKFMNLKSFCKLKIAIVYQGIFPSLLGASGADRRVRDLTRGLALKNEVCMFVPSDKNYNQPNTNEDEFDIVYLGKWKKGKNRILNKFFFWSRLKNKCLEVKFDCVLFYGTSIESIPVMKWMRNRNIFVAYEISDEASSSQTGLQKWRYKQTETRLPALSNLNIVISKYLFDMVRTVAPSTPALRIPILSDQDLFKNDKLRGTKLREKFSIDRNEILFAYVGGTWKEEGVSTLLRALKLAILDNSKIKLVIAGRLMKTERHDDLEGLVDELDLRNHVILVGWVGTDEVIDIYSGADVLCLPQIQHGFNVAGLPTKLAEYSAMGKPILASEVGDVPLYFTNGVDCILYKPGNIDIMAESMKRLSKDLQLRISLGKAAKKLAEANFNYINAGKKITNAILSIKES